MRGTWIEIPRISIGYVPAIGRPPCGGRGLKSDTDSYPQTGVGSRPPCGGRGLKCYLRKNRYVVLSVVPHAGDVD